MAYVSTCKIALNITGCLVNPDIDVTCNTIRINLKYLSSNRECPGQSLQENINRIIRIMFFWIFQKIFNFFDDIYWVIWKLKIKFKVCRYFVDNSFKPEIVIWYPATSKATLNDSNIHKPFLATGTIFFWNLLRYSSSDANCSSGSKIKTWIFNTGSYISYSEELVTQHLFYKTFVNTLPDSHSCRFAVATTN